MAAPPPNQPPRGRRPPQRQQALSLVQWNCRGFKDRTKRAHLRAYIDNLEHPAAVLALQETGAAVKLSGFNAFQRDPSTCLLVNKGYTAQEVDLDLNLEYSYVMVSVLPLRRTDSPVHILNIYCPPKLKNVTFSNIFSAALRIAGRDPLMIVGDFNAPCPMWGYRKEEPRGRKLAGLISTLGITLLTDPVHPTRVGYFRHSGHLPRPYPHETHPTRRLDQHRGHPR